mmetsp:Transcript_13017/g.20400  ORF Transcript_13017/g.20400 Transcript_13017/m.20400 type:complete len:231 (+) Transcript_13017:2191-2883(+)
MEFWRMGMGKKDEGMDVSHRRNVGFMGPAVCDPKFAMIFSSSGMKDLDRWQFCRITQSPFFRPVSSARFAVSPWPCPSETTCIRSRKPRDWAKSRRSVKGSAPGDRMKMMGVVLLASFVEFSMLKAGGSMKCGPRSHLTNSVTEKSRSGIRHTLMMIMRCICDKFAHFAPVSGGHMSLHNLNPSSKRPTLLSSSIAFSSSSRPGRAAVLIPRLSRMGLASSQLASGASLQ